MSGGIGIMGTRIVNIDGNSYVTKETPRRALSATFALKVLNIAGGATVTATLQARERDKPDTWSIVGAFSTITATGTYTLEASGIDEIFRFILNFDVGDTTSAAVTLLFRKPMWIPD